MNVLFVAPENKSSEEIRGVILDTSTMRVEWQRGLQPEQCDSGEYDLFLLDSEVKQYQQDMDTWVRKLAQNFPVAVIDDEPNPQAIEAGVTKVILRHDAETERLIKELISTALIYERHKRIKEAARLLNQLCERIDQAHG